MSGYKKNSHASSISSRSASTHTRTPSKTSEASASTISSSLRTLNDVRDQVSQEVAIRAITKAEILDGVRIGVSLIFSKSDDEDFLLKVANTIGHQLTLNDHLFALASTGQTVSAKDDPNPNSLIIRGSSEEYVQRAVLLASSKFIGRIETAYNEGNTWVAIIRDIGASSYDEPALWDVVRKSARRPMDPISPPLGSRGIDRILSDARSKLQRLTPEQAYDALREPEVGVPTFLVDIRPAAQRNAEGGIHGSLIVERNVLEWRFDPRCNARLPIADRYDLRVIVFCQEGYTSSLAAFALQELGLLNATDIIGGYKAWREARLPSNIRSLQSLAGSIV